MEEKCTVATVAKDGSHLLTSNRHYSADFMKTWEWQCSQRIEMRNHNIAKYFTKQISEAFKIKHQDYAR